SALPQIAHATVWTDWSFPVLGLNIFLSGYDVQCINLYDVFVRGVVAPGSPVAPIGSATAGSKPYDDDQNPNIPDDGNCAGLPGTLPAEVMEAVRRALATGVYVIPGSSAGCTTAQRVGGAHSNARGYITIDVVNNCSTQLPTSSVYLGTELLFDNVLIGDYQQINGDPGFGNFAQGNPLVHIRAIPEGGPAGSNPGTNLPYTFYDRYTVNAPGGLRRFDRRQPLPSAFAVRWIEGGTSAFQTMYKIWREGRTFGTQTCASAASNSAITAMEVIRFDEHENSFGFSGSVICDPFCTPSYGLLPEASITSTANTAIFPANVSTVDISGWMYLNLNNQKSSVRPSQNWVVASMHAQGRFSVDFDAAALGNGCSAAVVAPSPRIGPAGANGIP